MSRYEARKAALKSERKYQVVTQTPFSLDHAPRVTVRMRSHRIPIGQDTKFTLNVQSKPEAEVQWFHNGVAISESSHKYVFTNMSGVLSITIFDCQEEDSGTYRCVCTNSKGDASDYATLDVSGGGYTTFTSRRRDEEAPKGHVPEASKIDHYHTTHFKTGYAAESHLEVEETKTKITHERYTASSERYSSAERYESSIKYASTEYLSSGSSFSSDKFSLTGKQTASEAKVKTTAAVEEKVKPSLPARILIKPQSVTVSEGETARFSCDIDGEPAPTVTWLHESKTLSSSQRVLITSTQYKSSLEISSVTSADEGSYTVIAENSAGHQEAHFTLTIHRPPPKAEVKAVKSPEPSVKSPTPSVKSPEPTVTSPVPSVKSPEPSIKSPEPSVKSPKPSVKSPTVKSPEPSVTSPAPSVKCPEPASVQSPEPEEIKSSRAIKSPEPGIKSPQGIKSPERVKSPEPEGIKSLRGVKSPEPVGAKKPLGVKSPEPAGIKSPKGVKSPEPTGIKSPRALKSPEPTGIKSPRVLKSPEPEGLKSPPRMKSPPPTLSPKRVMSPPTVKAPPKVLSQVAAEACEGSVRMSCTCESNVKEVVWYVNGRKLSQSSHFEMHYSEGSCSLLIQDLTDRDQGEYTCEMTSDGGVSKSSFSFTGRVFQSILMKVTAYREQQVALKGSMTMSHKELSSSMMKKKEVHMMEESSSFSSATQQSMMSSMMEASSFSSMAAEMKFETTSLSSMSSMASETYAMSSSSLTEMVSHIEGSTFRSIGGPPRIEALPEDISIEPGKVLTVACAFSGDAKHIEWSRGGKTIEVTAGGRFHIDTTEDLTTLIITGVKGEDAGTYTLKLSNELGSDTATVHISIRSA